jgi:hypothetical protein
MTDFRFPRAISWSRLWSRVSGALLAVVLGLFSLISSPPSAQAESLKTVDTASYQALAKELSSLEAAPSPLSPAQQQRLADLTALESAVASSNDRATISNDTSHSVGLFASYKKDKPGQAPSFYVLAPGHSTDDDYNVVALYLPAATPLEWGDSGSVTAISQPRLVKVLDGEELQLTDPASGDAANASVKPGYRLNLPAFEVNSKTDIVTSLPSLSQADLDGQPETAPLD